MSKNLISTMVLILSLANTSSTTELQKPCTVSAPDPLARAEQRARRQAERALERKEAGEIAQKLMAGAYRKYQTVVGDYTDVRGN
jgi:hypothetical protein